MKAKKMNSAVVRLQNSHPGKSIIRTVLSTLFIAALFLFSSQSAYAHCDSYDGPVIKDAMKALETNNSKLLVKWITPEQEKEVISLFNKTYNLKKGDKEVYSILEKHFLETLVRLHRETEGAPYTGLKPAGSTKPIVQMADQSLVDKSPDKMVKALTNHIEKMIKEKYEKVAALEKVKNESPAKGREYVEAYVDYTHTVEAFHDIIDHGGAGHSHTASAEHNH